MSSLLQRLHKTTKIKDADILTDSKLFSEKEVISTSVPAINIALSGDIDGGLRPGVLSIAGPSRHFKTSYALLMASAYVKKHPDAVILYYDSEFGAGDGSLEAFGVPRENVLHIPITNIEELKFDLMQKLDNKNTDGIKRGDKVLILIDSIGNLASVKEANDAVNDNSAADMSRPKMLKQFWRLVTPHLTLKNIPLIAIQHVYQEMGCLDGDTLVKTETGLMPIKDIKIGDKVFAKTGLKEVLYAYTPGEIPTDGKQFFELEFDDGTKLKCTDNHRFLMKSGEWVQAGDFKIGDEFY